ncbi:MAG: hypothetical protein J6C91_05335 [Muribaculaceae bacterium]|nr:hypothetical protein [Muribaculaceae bacterium]
MLIEEGEGVSYVGDSERSMGPGDFMLIGPNLPFQRQPQQPATQLAVQALTSRQILFELFHGS